MLHCVADSVDAVFFIAVGLLYLLYRGTCPQFILQWLAVNAHEQYACIGMSPYTAHYATIDAKAFQFV